MINKFNIFFALSIFCINAQAQNNVGGTNSSASTNNNSPYTIGEIFVVGTNPNQNQSGTMGAYSAIVLKTKNGILSVQEKDIEVFPNPAKNELNIRFRTNLTKSEVHIFDMSGKQVVIKKIENNQIDISELIIGTYLLKLNEQTTIKITKE